MLREFSHLCTFRIFVEVLTSIFRNFHNFCLRSSSHAVCLAVQIFSSHLDFQILIEIHHLLASLTQSQTMQILPIQPSLFPHFVPSTSTDQIDYSDFRSRAEVISSRLRLAVFNQSSLPLSLSSRVEDQSSDFAGKFYEIIGQNFASIKLPLGG